MDVTKIKDGETTGISKDTIKSIEIFNDSQVLLDSTEFKETEFKSAERLAEIAATEKFILERKSAMEIAQSAYKRRHIQADTIWETPTMIMKDGAPLFDIPLEKAIVLVAESEVGDKDIIYDIKPVGSSTDIDRIAPNRIVMDHFYVQDTTSEKAEEFRLSFFKYGFAVMFEGLTTSTKKIRGEQAKDYKTGSAILTGSTDQTKIMTEMLIGSRVLNSKNFLIDDGVKDYKMAIDCIELEYISKREVLRRYNGLQYFNLSEVVKALQDNNNEITHYWNKSEDIYGVLINSRLVYEGPNPYPHKKLPFTVAVMKKSQKTPYGEGGFIELLQFAVPYLSGLMNISIKQATNASMPPLLLGNNVELDSDEAYYDIGAIWHLSGPLSEVREMKVAGPDMSIFNIKETIYDFIVQVTGLDLRQIYSKGEATAFATGVQEQTKNKRLTSYARSLSFAYHYFLNLRLKNIHYYLDSIAVTPLLDPGVSKVTYKKILLENTRIDKFKDGKTVYSEVPGAYSEFELDPESIRGEFEVSIKTEKTKPIFDEMVKEETNLIMDQVTKISNMSPEQLTTMGLSPRALLKFVLEGYGKDIDKLQPNTMSKVIEQKNIEDEAKEQQLLDELEANLTNATETEPTTATPAA